MDKRHNIKRDQRIDIQFHLNNTYKLTPNMILKEKGEFISESRVIFVKGKAHQ